MSLVESLSLAMPVAIAIRGDVLGLGMGLAVGFVLAAVLFAWRSSRPQASSAE